MLCVAHAHAMCGHAMCVRSHRLTDISDSIFTVSVAVAGWQVCMRTQEDRAQCERGIHAFIF